MSTPTNNEDPGAEKLAIQEGDVEVHKATQAELDAVQASLDAAVERSSVD